MRFEDEPYVRLYKRDTTTWRMLTWQARCILPLILRAMDRAGLLELDEHGVEGLAVVIMMPVEIVEEGLKTLLQRDILRMHGTVLVWPKYIEGQEAAQSDRARQRAARERARDVAAAQAIGVTIRDELSRNVTPPSQNVTDRHVVSHGVTSCHSEQNRTEQSLTEQKIPPNPPGGSGNDPVGGDDAEKPSPHERYAVAYAEGIRLATGQPFPEPGKREHGPLAQMCAFAAKRKGVELESWFSATAAEYRKAKASSAQFERGFAPSKCLEWLQAGKPVEQPKSQTNIRVLQAVDEDAPWRKKLGVS